MPFETLETVSRRLPRSSGSISYRRVRGSKGHRPQPRLIISIPKTLAADFKTRDGDTYALLLGSGDDAGKARIRRDAKGTGRCTPLQHTFMFNFGFVPYLGTSAGDREPLQVRAITGKDGSGFEFDLPVWFKPDDDADAGA